MRRPLLSFALLIAASACSPVHAGDVVTDAVQAAYAPYRLALFGTNAKAPAQAQQALAAAQREWSTVVERFGTKPPPPYDRDTGFTTTLSQVTAAYDKAAAEVAAGRLPEAHETLEAVRDMLATLRLRNGVVVYSDHMNAYHAEMERLLVDGPKALAGPRGVPWITAQGGVLGYLVRQLRERAPAATRQAPEFDELLKAVEASVQKLQDAAAGQDVAAIQEAMSRIKAPYSRLFVKFG